ncbi:MAG: tetratricopeptide repeat protein [Desulfovibrionaceae bacterium]|nr:tetratricopeptide repeat protein [Desulfovibrionaceae bacterium]
MAFADFQAKQRLNKQKAIVREYFMKRDGQALCLSDDPTFVALLRSTLKDLAVTKAASLVIIPDASRTLKSIADSMVDHKMPVLFIERVMSATGDTSFMIRQFKDTYPELRIMVMTTTAQKERIMLLHEAGADNFVLKPISSNELIEKMAVTLREPGIVRQLLDKARTFIVSNVGGEAMKITRKVLEVKPDSASGYVVMGDALRISGEKDKAQLAYERACKYSEEYLEPLQRLVDLAKEDDKKEMQLEYLKRLDTLSPLNAQRKVEMGELQVALGNTEAATQLFDVAVARAYKDAMAQVAAMTEKIAVSLQDSDPVQAEKYLRRCLELKGRDLTVDDLSTFNQLGISLRKQGRWEDAIVEYKKAFKIAPRSDTLFYNIALAYADGRDFETAITNLQKALSINPDLPRGSATMAYNMGVVFSFGYTREKALQCLEIALELDPNHEQARKALDTLRAADADAG